MFEPLVQFGGGHGGRVPFTFSDGGEHSMPCPPYFFLFRFCSWRGFKNKSDVCHVLCEELFFFMLDVRPHIAKLMLKQFGVVSLILLDYKF